MDITASTCITCNLPSISFWWAGVYVPYAFCPKYFTKAFRAKEIEFDKVVFLNFKYGGDYTLLRQPQHSEGISFQMVIRELAMPIFIKS